MMQKDFPSSNKTQSANVSDRLPTSAGATIGEHQIDGPRSDSENTEPATARVVLASKLAVPTPGADQKSRLLKPAPKVSAKSKKMTMRHLAQLRKRKNLPKRSARMFYTQTYYNFKVSIP